MSTQIFKIWHLFVFLSFKSTLYKIQVTLLFMIIYLFILCAEYSLLLWTLQLSLLSLLSIAVICAAMLNVWIGLELVWSWPKSSLSWQTQLFFRSSVFRPIDCKSTLGFSPQGGVRTPQSFNITPDSYRYWWSDHVFQYLSLLLRDSSRSELQYSVEGKKKNPNSCLKNGLIWKVYIVDL